MKKIFTIVLVILCMPISVWAVKAIPSKILFSQPNGDTFSGNLKGDEWFNWIEDKQGAVIQFNKKSNYYEYSTLKNENARLELVPSGVKVSNSNSQDNRPSSSFSNTQIKPIDKSKLIEIWQFKRNEKYPPQFRKHSGTSFLKYKPK